jgi:hypothetical protein
MGKSKTADDLVFKELPAPKAPSRWANRSAPIKDALKKRPGQWAVVLVSASVPSAYRAQQQKKHSWGPEFEVTGREKEVYARYVGPKAKLAR